MLSAQIRDSLSVTLPSLSAYSVTKGGGRMIAMLCWIVGCYGMAVAAVHLAHGWQKLMRGSRPAPWMHVVIVSENDERHIEWMVRAFGFYTWLRGRQLHMTLLDCGSTDATLAIAERAVRERE